MLQVAGAAPLQYIIKKWKFSIGTNSLALCKQWTSKDWSQYGRKCKKNEIKPTIIN